MKIIIEIPNEKVKAYAELYKVLVDKSAILDNFDEAVENTLKEDELVLSPAIIGDEYEKMLLGFALVAIAQIGLKEDKE